MKGMTEMAENKLPYDLAGLEERLGYTFKNKELLVSATTHSS